MSNDARLTRYVVCNWQKWNSKPKWKDEGLKWKWQLNDSRTRNPTGERFLAGAISDAVVSGRRPLCSGSLVLLSWRYWMADAVVDAGGTLLASTLDLANAWGCYLLAAPADVAGCNCAHNTVCFTVNCPRLVFTRVLVTRWIKLHLIIGSYGPNLCWGFSNYCSRWSGLYLLGLV